MDGYMNLTKYEVKDGKAIGLECKGWVRVNPEVIPPVSLSAQGKPDEPITAAAHV